MLVLPTTMALADDLDFADLSLEQLSAIKVTSVSKRPQALSDAAASIFVISADDIHRSGARTLPEILRLAPNLQVARVDARNYAVTARGFNGVFSNKLLVMIDGRTVYTPLFSGVFWDAQDLVLQDIERIEVISGPGATLWGVNAVDGVINIITRSAKDSQGLLLAAGDSHSDRDAELRYGGKLDAGYYRAYVKVDQQDDSYHKNGIDNIDGMVRRQAGLSSNWNSGGSSLRLQGDFYHDDLHQMSTNDITTQGLNMLGRWEYRLASGSNLHVQAILDRTNRDQPMAFREQLDTTDIQIQHSLTLFKMHQVVWGGGYRNGYDVVTPTYPA